MPKPKLTVKEAKLVKAKAEGKTHVQAAKEAEYLPNASDRTIQTEVNNTLKKPHVQEALYAALKRKGLTPDDIMNPVAEALKHDELDMRLKGHDRAMKIIQPKGDGGTVNINFNNVAKEDKDEFGI